jgi:hypothetical protein
MRRYLLLVVLPLLLMAPLTVFGQEEAPPADSGQTGKRSTVYPDVPSVRDSTGDVSTMRQRDTVTHGGLTVRALSPTIKGDEVVGRINHNSTRTSVTSNTRVDFWACEDANNRTDPCWNSTYAQGYDYDGILSGNAQDHCYRSQEYFDDYTRAKVSSGGRSFYAESPNTDAGEFTTSSYCRAP